MLVTLFCFCFFVIQGTLSNDIEITTFVQPESFSTSKGLELDKTLKEWRCIVFHSKELQCLGFAVVTLTWILKRASHIVFLTAGSPGHW